MNEVTKIHLGRQAFAISNEAHKELRDYLDAIKRHVSDEDVVSEVELRMAELLGEHGVSGDKVILPADVQFLKEQLGDPKDFAEEDSEEQTAEPVQSKRLFRDTDNAMLAGVAAGLANYFGIDALLVRLLFVIATFAGGWGILIYIVLWILVPEAKSPSDRLQMQGKPVTVDSLRSIVENADVKGAAQRGGNVLADIINTVFKVILRIMGVAFIAIGVGILIGMIGAVVYSLVHGGSLVQNNLFPVGFKEHILLYTAAATAGLIAVFIVLFGLSIFRRKWPIPTWITGVLIGLILIGLPVGGALTADVAPQVRSTYNANEHTTVRNMQPFSAVDLTNVNDNADINIETASTYSVSLYYYGHPDLGNIKTTVSHGTLYINTQEYNQNRDCQAICIPNNYNLTITIYTPKSPTLIDPNGMFGEPTPPNAPTTPQPAFGS